MGGKDRSVTRAGSLARTGPGRRMLLQGAAKSPGYRSYAAYSAEAEARLPGLADGIARDICGRIRDDASPASTQRAFADEVGYPEMELSGGALGDAAARLADPAAVLDRVMRILDSNFVKMTLPVLYALYDGAAEHAGRDASLRRDVVEGHVLAIDLSEPMDRIMDRDEDLEYLDDYRLMNPHLLAAARSMISRGGEAVLSGFEEGFRDAMAGQRLDAELKSRPRQITWQDMEESYKKYRSVMGTAGSNMALAERPLCEAYRTGMGRAAEAAGCGNEIEDSVKSGTVKVPSWPLYYSVITGDVGSGFRMALGRGSAYLRDARMALDMLPDGYSRRGMLEFLFLALDHYNRHWYGRLGGAMPGMIP
ncbi:MAG: hypothetical protein MPI95_07450 [Nitrosopumilus sp.]|nr:hypothetical protein [Nitrosopumilus sp.]MDA7943801.1 hypothetical protein [Nitrosopumilus sp.]MDA7953330.1 hypothetical protein [Nitrosopumilus sp.]MDA7958899.1 hypothetical protein [Nitrosopumilus sp.]MDA7959782.1 hypothetical protein [Nitrosopumilus sp.]